jgi:ferredoxin
MALERPDGVSLDAEVDSDLCQGHARCNATAPDLFRLDIDGYAISPGPIPARLSQQALTARNACPERAITLRERPANSGFDHRSSHSEPT